LHYAPRGPVSPFVAASEWPVGIFSAGNLTEKVEEMLRILLQTGISWWIFLWLFSTLEEGDQGKKFIVYELKTIGVASARKKIYI